MTEVEGTKVSSNQNSLADVLLVTNGFLLESLLRSVRKSDAIEPTAMHCGVEMTDRGPLLVLGGRGEIA